MGQGADTPSGGCTSLSPPTQMAARMVPKVDLVTADPKKLRDIRSIGSPIGPLFGPFTQVDPFVEKDIVNPVGFFRVSRS